MAAQQVKSLLMQKLGAEFVKAHEEHKNVKPEPKGELPGGIKNGIARLVQCKIVEISKGDHAGKLMFYASGSVVAPTEHEGVPIKGLFTSIMEPIYATPTRKRKTVADHIKFVYETLASLGLSLPSLKPETIELAMDQLRTVKPFFRFRTWAPPKQTTGQYAGKESMTMHFWDGKVDGYKPTTEADKKNAVADTSENVEPPVPDSVPDEHPEAPESIGTKATVNIIDEKAVPKQDDIDPDMIDKSDIDSLAKMGDDGDLTAGQRLLDMATQAGIEKKLIDSAATFKEVADLIRAKNAPEQNGDVTLGLGENWKFYPIHPLTKKKIETPVTGEIIHIDEEKGTVNLKDIANPQKIYRNVAVDQLETVS